MRRRPAAYALALGALVILAVVTVLTFGGGMLRFAADRGAQLAGYRLRYDRLVRRPGGVTIYAPDLANAAHEPVLTAQSVDVSFSLTGAFGGPHPFGISSVRLERPKLTIVHHRDGTYNVNLPAPRSSQNARPFVLPQIRIAVHDGSIGLVDETKIFRHSRKLALVNVQLDAALDPRARSHFAASLALLEDGGPYPISAAGTLDDGRGYEFVRVRAKTVGVAPLIDYALNSPSLHVANGVLNDVDASLYALRGRTGELQRHVAASAHLDHFQPYLNGIAKPLRDGRGALRVYDDGLAMPKVDGSIAGVPVRIAGAIYGLSHPYLRLGIAGRGALGRLISLSDAAKKLPLTGDVAFRLFVEGDATGPATFAGFASTRITYGAFPLDRPSGLVALAGKHTSIVRSALNYSGIGVAARGDLELAKHTKADLLALVDAPSASVPYAPSAIGPMAIGATVVASGVDAALETRGVFGGENGAERLDGTVSIDARGEGTIGPVRLRGPGSRALDVRVALDRPHGGGGAAFVSVRDFHVTTAGAQPTLAGIAVPRLPPFSGDLTGDLIGTFAANRFTLAGSADAAHVAALGTSFDDLGFGGVVADGSRAAAHLRYRGSLAALAHAAGSTVTAAGRVDLPIDVVADGTSSIVAQLSHGRLEGASIAGVPVDGVEATLGLRGQDIDVYAARLQSRGRDLEAQGAFGDGGTVAVSTSGVNLASFRSFGLPVETGTGSALASVGGTLDAPRVVAGVAASDLRSTNAKLAGLALTTSSGLTYSGDHLELRDGTLVAGSAVGRIDARVDGVRSNPRGAAYVVDASVAEADIGTLARLFRAPQSPEGALDANVRVAGRGARAAIAGSVRVPQGSINGLPYREARVALDGTSRALRLRGGSVTVGTTTLGFAGDVSARAQTLALNAPHVRLEDFNDYFDRGDTLGGGGSIALRVVHAPNLLAIDGDARFARTRFRRFELGDASATFATRGRTVATTLALGSRAGRITAHGSVRQAATQPLLDPLHRSSASLAATARGVDLGVWLPAAGIIAPVAGSVDATADVAGTFPRITAHARARLNGGTYEKVAIRTATLDARASEGRATIASAVLAIDNLRARASGSFGFRPTDKADLTLDTDVTDVGALAKTITARSYDVSGSLHDRLRITGTARAPRAATVLDAASLRYAKYTLPRASVEAAATRTRVTLTRSEIDLQSGRILADGAVPLARDALAVAPAAPLAFHFTAERIDLSQFAAFFPKGTQAAGVLDGSVGLGGSVARPGLGGTLALSGGSFSGPSFRSKVVDAGAQLTFAGNMATLHDASAKVGGGSIVASGSAFVPSLRQPGRDVGGALHLTLANPYLDAPQYLRGRANGTLSLTRTPGAPISVGGNLAFTQTRIPLSAIFNPNSPKTQATAPPLPVAFDLGVDVGRDVRLQSGPVDVGTAGTLHVGGTLADPQVTGRLESVGGGTLSFYRTFVVADGSSLDFAEGGGLTPIADVEATTNVSNPSTDIALHVTGPTTQLNVDLTSDPAYSREQILGLLVGAQALGAVSGLAATPGSGQQQNPFQSLAEGQLGTLLTQNVLQPFSSKIGGALGLSDLAVTYLPGNGVNVGAKRRLFANVNIVFAESFNYPQRQSVGLQASNRKNTTAAQVTFFTQPGSNRFNPAQEGALLSSNPSVTGAQPLNGDEGISFSLQRKF